MARGTYLIVKLLIIVNGIFAIIDGRHTDVAIYIAAVWMIWGFQQIEEAIRERK